MQLPDVRRWFVMDKAVFDRVVRYNTTMAMVRRMLSLCLISEDEYAQIDRIIANENGLDLSVIYR